MRIATYNLWNSPTSWPTRLQAICEELSRIDADLVALQEVPSRVLPKDARNAAAYLAERMGYSHFAFRAYPDDPDEGPALLSKDPLAGVECGWETEYPVLRECGLRARVTVAGIQIAVTNVHLDWQSVAAREAQIVAVTEWFAARTEPGCHEILCGDFNSRPASSLYRFLAGQQTLAGKETPPWHDLAACHADHTGSPLLPTLDFATNPRWKGAPALVFPARVDWILLQDRWPEPMLYLRNASLFGVEPTAVDGVVPSDHYGVLADLEGEPITMERAP